MDWFLYDNGLRHERVKLFEPIFNPNEAKYSELHVTRESQILGGVPKPVKTEKLTINSLYNEIFHWTPVLQRVVHNHRCLPICLSVCPSLYPSVSSAFFSRMVH